MCVRQWTTERKMNGWKNLYVRDIVQQETARSDEEIARRLMIP